MKMTSMLRHQLSDMGENGYDSRSFEERVYGLRVDQFAKLFEHRVDVMCEQFIHTDFGYCCYVEADDGKLFLYKLYVYPAFRGRKLSRLLIAMAMAAVQIRTGREDAEVYVDVVPEEGCMRAEDLANYYRRCGLTVRHCED